MRSLRLRLNGCLVTQLDRHWHQRHAEVVAGEVMHAGYAPGQHTDRRAQAMRLHVLTLRRRHLRGETGYRKIDRFGNR